MAKKAYIISKSNESIFLYAMALYFNRKYDEALKHFYMLKNYERHKQDTFVYIAHCLSMLRKDLFIALKYLRRAYNMGDYDKSLCFIAQIYIDFNIPLKAVLFFSKIINDMGSDFTYLKNLNYEEIQSMITVLLNRYEIEENKVEIPDRIYNQIMAKKKK